MKKLLIVFSLLSLGVVQINAIVPEPAITRVSVAEDLKFNSDDAEDKSLGFGSSYVAGDLAKKLKNINCKCKFIASRKLSCECLRCEHGATYEPLKPTVLQVNDFKKCLMSDKQFINCNGELKCEDERCYEKVCPSLDQEQAEMKRNSAKQIEIAKLEAEQKQFEEEEQRKLEATQQENAAQAAKRAKALRAIPITLENARDLVSTFNKRTKEGNVDPSKRLAYVNHIISTGSSDLEQAGQDLYNYIKNDPKVTADKTKRRIMLEQLQKVLKLNGVSIKV